MQREGVARAAAAVVAEAAAAAAAAATLEDSQKNGSVQSRTRRKAKSRSVKAKRMPKRRASGLRNR
jgi:hypothetical protein